MKDENLLRIGTIGALVAAVCCFTPLLVLLLGAVGLSAVVGWLDIVLLPALAASIGVIVFAVHRRRKASLQSR